MISSVSLAEQYSGEQSSIEHTTFAKHGLSDDEPVLHEKNSTSSDPTLCNSLP